MGKKILIIDDSEQDQKIIKWILVKGGYEDLIFAGSGEEGVALARKEKPDLIITDLMMPKTSGAEVNNILKRDASTRNIPILFNTSLVDPAEKNVLLNGLSRRQTYPTVSLCGLP